MKQDFENIPLVKADKRFEIEFNGHYAFIDYRETTHQIALIHTEAEPELAGTELRLRWLKKPYIILKKMAKTITILPICFCIYQKTSRVETYC